MARLRDQRVHARLRLRRGEAHPIFAGAAGRERRRQHHDLAARLRQPRHELRAVLELGEDDRLGLHRLALRARAPGQHRAFQRARARCDEIDVRHPTPPSTPGAVVLTLGFDAPRLVLRDGPVAGCQHPGTSRQARTDGVEERLTEGLDAGRVHADLPDALDGRVVGGEGGGALGFRLRGRGEA